MATWEDVARALRTAIVPVVNATGLPQTKVYLGWPKPEVLLADLRKSPVKAHVSLYAKEPARLAPEIYLGEAATVIIPPTETVSVVSGSATLGGTLTSGDNIFLVVNGFAFGETVQVGQTLADIATLLADAITTFFSSSISAVAVGAVITLTGTVYSFSGAAFGQGQVCYVTGRYNRELQISVWAADNEDRQKLTQAILILIGATNFIALSDMSLARIRFSSDQPTDSGMPSGVMRHDINVFTEYISFREELKATVAWITLQLRTMVCGSVGWTTANTNPFGVPMGANISDHRHIHETPSGTRPGSVFATSGIPKSGSESLVHNGIEQEKISLPGPPSIGQYTINGNIITMGDTVNVGSSLRIHYEI